MYAFVRRDDYLSKKEVKFYHAFLAGVLQPGIYISLFFPYIKEVQRYI